jgi:Phage integrase, N-terminal SAM-like domain
VSVERVERKGGVVWRVRWREGGRERSRVVGRKRDAEALDAELRRRRRLGTLDAGADTLADFAERWWRLHAAPKLAPSTRARYAFAFDVHVLPRLGGYRLRELSPAVVDDFRAALEAQAGAVTVAKALTVLSSILSLAVLRGELERNPVSAVRKPGRQSSRRVRPPAPEAVEALRARLRPRDATLVSVLA